MANETIHTVTDINAVIINNKMYSLVENSSGHNDCDVCNMPDDCFAVCEEIASFKGLKRRDGHYLKLIGTVNQKKLQEAIEV